MSEEIKLLNYIFLFLYLCLTALIAINCLLIGYWNFKVILWLIAYFAVLQYMFYSYKKIRKRLE